MGQLENFRLKVFRTVADQLSFRRAAEHLFLTQPAVTLQIKALESDLGVRLFDRSANRVTLTPQGSTLLRYAERIATIASKAEDELRAGTEQFGGELSLGVSTTIAQYVLPRLIGAFFDEHPHVQLLLQSGNTEKVVELVLKGKVAVGLIEGPARRRGVRTEAFMLDELVLIVPPDFKADHLSALQFLSSNLLIREQGSGSRRVVETALERAGVKLKGFKRVMNLDSTEEIKSAVEAGLGIGFVSRWAISKELGIGTLKVADVQGLTVSRHFSLVTRSGSELKGLADAFRVFALSRGRRLSSGPRKPGHSSFLSR